MTMIIITLTNRGEYISCDNKITGACHVTINTIMQGRLPWNNSVVYVLQEYMLSFEVSPLMYLLIKSN